MNTKGGLTDNLICFIASLMGMYNVCVFVSVMRQPCGTSKLIVASEGVWELCGPGDGQVGRRTMNQTILIGPLV